MDVLKEVGIGLLTAFIGFLIGIAWKAAQRRRPYWQAWKFWQPFIRGDISIVVDKFNSLNKWEASGLVGVGGMQATAEFVALLKDVGLAGREHEIKISFHDQTTGSLYENNLVCIGGPDSNEITKEILDRLKCTIRFVDPAKHSVVIKDFERDAQYFPLRGEDRSTVTVDYGILVKCRNPFNEDQFVIIAAGSFGYGTWAAAKLARSKEFLRNEYVRSGSNIECLYSTVVVKEIPQKPKIIAIRRIQKQSAS